MVKTRRRLVAFVCALALAAGLLVVPAQAADTKNDQYEIVVLVADLDGLRSQGVNLAPKLTVANLGKRWQMQFDSHGKVNGKTFNVIPVTWDPIDPTSYEETCVKATQDNQPFAVFNANGYSQSRVGCITVDNDTLAFMGEGGYDDLYKASGKNLLTLGLPGEAAALAGVQIADKQKLIPKTAKIGILSANEPGIKAAGDTAEKELKKAGYDVVEKVEINTVGQDAAGTQRDAAASVSTFQAAGADTVFVLLNFATSGSFFDEAHKSGAGFQYLLIDAAASVCSQFGASRTPVIVAEEAVPCVTALDTRAVPTKDAIKQDTPFEAKCRKTFDAGFSEQSQPGVPSGDITDGAGKTLTEDMATFECTMVNLFVKALKKAGKNATPADVYDAMLTIKKGDAAYMSGGAGGFAKNKPWFANSVHLEVLNPATTATAPDANGLYDGCPAPVNCWVPREIDGQEWITIQRKA